MTAFGMTGAGEFSLAVTDCGKYLNGVNLGTRYEGEHRPVIAERSRTYLRRNRQLHRSLRPHRQLHTMDGLAELGRHVQEGNVRLCPLKHGRAPELVLLELEDRRVLRLRQDRDARLVIQARARAGLDPQRPARRLGRVRERRALVRLAHQGRREHPRERDRDARVAACVHLARRRGDAPPELHADRRNPDAVRGRALGRGERGQGGQRVEQCGRPDGYGGPHPGVQLPRPVGRSGRFATQPAVWGSCEARDGQSEDHARARGMISLRALVLRCPCLLPSVRLHIEPRFTHHQFWTVPSPTKPDLSISIRTCLFFFLVLISVKPAVPSVRIPSLYLIFAVITPLRFWFASCCIHFVCSRPRSSMLAAGRCVPGTTRYFLASSVRGP